LFTERSKSVGVSVSVSPSVLLVVAAALTFFAGAAFPQVVPYITTIAGEDDMEKSEDDEKAERGRLRLLGTFKLFNPDTVPFYMWISFDNGGRFKHVRHADLPTVRLVDLELHYKNALNQTMVKKFSNSSEPRVRKRFAGSWLGGGRSSVKKRTRGRAVTDDEDSDVEAEAASSGRGRGNGASEAAFWKEDAQAYYEMELWGALYAPDAKAAVVAGRYAENIKFEIEPAR